MTEKPPAIDWANKSADEILADVQALVELAVSESPSPTVRITATPENADALWRALGLRRTRAGQWTIDGRRYQSKRLALDSMHDRLAQRLVMRVRGRIDTVEIKGTVVV